MRKTEHQLHIKTYFRDAAELKAGAPVALAGVKVGVVEIIQPRPELKQAPAEVVIALRTNYALNIPNDSVVSIATAGVLGETFATIDVANTSGAPIGNGAVLKSVPRPVYSAQQLLERFSEILKAKNCASESPGAKNRRAATSEPKPSNK